MTETGDDAGNEPYAAFHALRGVDLPEAAATARWLRDAVSTVIECGTDGTGAGRMAQIESVQSLIIRAVFDIDKKLVERGDVGE